MRFASIICCCVLLVIIYLFYKNYRKKNLARTWMNPIVEVGQSAIAGRGIFAKTSFQPGEIVEICPYVSDSCSKIQHGVLNDYLFTVKEGCGVGLGYCSLYNHSDTHNAAWNADEVNKSIVVRATERIQPGDEITVSYGDNYWKSRTGKVN